MRSRSTLIIASAVVVLGVVALIAWLSSARFDTSLQFRFQDSVSRNWVWNATVHLEDREIRAFYQSDAGPVPFTFTHLKPGKSTLALSAPGYEGVTVPVSLRRGVNRLDSPIEMKGIEIPTLDHFLMFEELSGEDISVQIRPVGTDGHAVVNHPCLDIWVGAQVSVQLRNGVPAQESQETGNTRGTVLYKGPLPWQWDPAPETVFRYKATIPGAKLTPDSSLYRVVDYLIVVPDPRRISGAEVGALTAGVPSFTDAPKLAAYFEPYKGKLRYFFDTSWNVKAREQ